MHLCREGHEWMCRKQECRGAHGCARTTPRVANKKGIPEMDTPNVETGLRETTPLGITSHVDV